MTDEQVEDLREFVDPEVIGCVNISMPPSPRFEFKTPGEERYITMDIDALTLYLQDHFGLSKKQTDAVYTSFGQLMEDQIDLLSEALAQGLQDVVEEVLEQMPSKTNDE